MGRIACRLFLLALLLPACQGEVPAAADRPDGAGTGAGDGGSVGTDGAGTPAFQGEAVPIPAEVRQQMTGSSWHQDLSCPSLDSLSLLRMTHWGFDGEVHQGEMVVASSVDDDVLEAFRRIYDARFPIERMVLIHHYGGDDDASMADNNTSAFNCRAVTGGNSLSQHSYGTAIDINPLQNPYVNGGTVLPPGGQAYLDRNDVRPGMIRRPDPVTSAFDALGWGWGGDWSSLKDYQHFSESGQ